VFYLLVPLIGISAVLTVLFVKKVSLKRADDQAKKEEAREWMRQRKAKRAGRGVEGEEEGRGEWSGSKIENGGVSGGSTDETLVHGGGVELEAEDAGRGAAQAYGAGVARKEGLQQGPIGAESKV
jgi:hypothetical protein